MRRRAHRKVRRLRVRSDTRGMYLKRARAEDWPRGKVRRCPLFLALSPLGERLRRSSFGAFAPPDRGKCHRKYFEVQEERPIFDVENIERDHLFETQTAPSRNLPQTGDARL